MTDPAPRPPARRYPEVSLSSILLGVFVGAIMNAAITYAGLKIGFTIVGSAILAVLGFGVLRGILRRGTILEVNITQTIGSAVNTSNAGVIFTVPVLLLLGYTLDFTSANFWWLALAGTAGAALGVAFLVPLRKQMIEVERLRFPSGTAVAAILKSPGAGAKKSIVLLIGAVIGAMLYLPAGVPQLTRTADPASYDALVEQKKVSAADAERGRFVASITSAADIPAQWIVRGKAVAEKFAADEEARMKADRPSRAPNLPADDRLAKTLYQISTGAADLAALNDFKPRVALPGYGSLGIPGLDNDKILVGKWLGLPPYIAFTLAIAPFAIGAGFLTGRNGLVVLAGGLLATFIVTPIAWNSGWLPATMPEAGASEGARMAFNRPLGIGMLLGGAIMGLFAALPAVREALRSLKNAGPSVGGGRDEMSIKTLVIVGVVAFIALLLAAEMVTDPWGRSSEGLFAMLPGWLSKALTVLIAVVWIWFAGLIIAQCAGMTDWSPISGMALLTIVLAMALMGSSNVVVALALGVALCVAISLASDLMGDLKTGHLVGSRPARQQAVELGASLLGPVIALSTLLIIAAANNARGEPPVGGVDMPAPQAQTLLTIVEGVQGGQMPYALYGFGTLLGVLLGLGTFAGLGVLVGLSMFLPTHYVMVYGIGCVIQIIVAKVKGKRWAEEWGVPFCAGLIVGEALLSLTISGLVLARA